MCGIFTSDNEDMFKYLQQINLHRGHVDKISITLSNPIQQVKTFHKGQYNVGHIQAPTNQIQLENTNTNTQPVFIDGNFIVHNGILKQSYIEQQINKYRTSFDTEILFRLILEHGFDILNDVDGSFACILCLNDNYYVFRNNPGVIFMDEHLNISTTKFKNSDLIPEGQVFMLNLKDKKTEIVSRFKSKSKPYFLM